MPTPRRTAWSTPSLLCWRRRSSPSWATRRRVPFGHPVPGSAYRSPKDAVPLDQTEPGTEWIVDRIPEDDQGLLDYLVANRVLPGEVVSIEEVAPSRGVITLVCNDNHVAFSHAVGSKIWASPRPKEG